MMESIIFFLFFFILFGSIFGFFYYLASKGNLTLEMKDLPDDPIYSGPNGEKVPIPYFEERFREHYGNCLWGFIQSFGVFRLRVRGLPKGSTPLPSYEKDDLLARLSGNWKIQPLTSLKETDFHYEDVYVTGDKIVFSGGTHMTLDRDKPTDAHFPKHEPMTGKHGRSRDRGRRLTKNKTTHMTGKHGRSRDRGRRLTKNKTTEQNIVPFRALDGTLFIDQVGSKLVRESADGGELEFDNAFDFKFLWQREWKRIASSGGTTSNIASGGPPAVATVVTSSSGGRDFGKELLQLKELRDQGVLTEQEYLESKTKLMNQWTSSPPATGAPTQPTAYQSHPVPSAPPASKVASSGYQSGPVTSYKAP